MIDLSCYGQNLCRCLFDVKKLLILLIYTANEILIFSLFLQDLERLTLYQNQSSWITNWVKMAERVKAPLLFPCASRVHMPHVGDDDSLLRQRRASSNDFSSGFVTPVYRTPMCVTPDVNEEYVKKISTDLSFGEEVVRDRCFHLLPYSDKYFKEALDISNLIAASPKTSKPMGRYNNRIADKKHLPCHIQSRQPHKVYFLYLVHSYCSI